MELIIVIDTVPIDKVWISKLGKTKINWTRNYLHMTWYCNIIKDIIKDVHINTDESSWPIFIIHIICKWLVNTKPKTPILKIRTSFQLLKSYSTNMSQDWYRPANSNGYTEVIIYPCILCTPSQFYTVHYTILAATFIIDQNLYSSTS